MPNQTTKLTDRNGTLDIGNIIIRWIVTSIVLLAVAFLTPGFTIQGMWALVAAAAIIIVLDVLIEKVTGIDASPFGKGLVGFIVAALIIYATQFIVAGFSVTAIGAIIAAILIGAINALIPGRVL